MNSRALCITILISTLFLTGCTHEVKNEVCKGVKSMGMDVSTPCDMCYQILERSGQQEICLEKREMEVFGNKKTLMVHLDQKSSEWRGCFKLDGEEQLKCGCCLVKGWAYDDGKCISNDPIAALQKTRNLYDLATKKELSERSESEYMYNGRCRR